VVDVDAALGEEFLNFAVREAVAEIVPLGNSLGGVLRGDDAESHDQVTAARQPGFTVVDKLQLQFAPGSYGQRRSRTRSLVAVNESDSALLLNCTPAGSRYLFVAASRILVRPLGVRTCDAARPLRGWR